MLVFENEFIAMYAYEAEQLFYFRWLPATAHMAEEQYKEIMETYVALARQYNSDKLLANNVALKFVIVPEMRAWIGQRIARAAIELGLKRIAVVQPKDFFVLFSVESAISTMSANVFQMNFFDDSLVALQWLGLSHVPDELRPVS